MQNNTGKIVKVSGPLIVAENMADVKMYDVVKVSKEGKLLSLGETRLPFRFTRKRAASASGKKWFRPVCRCPSSLLRDLSRVFTTEFSVRLKSLRRFPATE